MKTQVESGKHIKIGDTKMFNTELIYTIVIGIQVSSRANDIKSCCLMSYHQYPQQCEIRVVKAKSVLKKVLQEEVSSRCIKKTISTVEIDGSAMLYLIPWPASSVTVGYFVFIVTLLRHWYAKQ